TTINRWNPCPGTGRIYATNPCSEYIFLDDTACNLASLNLTKFLRGDGTFDVEAYRHAIRVFFLAQEVLVDFSSYPTRRIAENSHRLRPLGLGYANLGTLLMLLGVPYDSDEARAWAGALTALLTGEAYATSARMAARKGPFEEFYKNREPFLRVIQMHRQAAYSIDATKAPAYLVEEARRAWDTALELGQVYGYRNAQATVLAPTGTIGLLLDCDTTGIEPDFALVKFKKLAGGGSFKIVNRAVPEALRRLGYTEAQVQDMLKYLLGSLTFEGAPHIHQASLRAKGFTDEEIAQLEARLPQVLDLDGLFVPGVVPETTLQRLGFTVEQCRAPGFRLLVALGWTPGQIQEANDWICGRQTLEGAPHLRPEHLPVFDCANKCGPSGQRYIEPMGHVRMLAAVQPFLSGGVSKTVNLPNEATVEDIERIYVEAWRMGVKCISVYRDGCKASQPLNTGRKVEEPAPTGVPAAISSPASRPRVEVPTSEFPRLQRRRLPKKRYGFTQEARVAGQKIYLRTGEYEDGTLGEIFIDMHKEGAAFRSMLNCFAIAISLGLQYGVPLEEFVDAFVFTRFEPQGPVEGHPHVKFATSIIDYIFRVLGIEYLKRYDLAHVPPEEAFKEDLGARRPDLEEEASKELSHPSEDVSKAGPSPVVYGSAMSRQARSFMMDAPACDKCGHITVRNGSCYRCLNCGNSMGCS
ncbi:MAG: vitamin B12-dependent ribonucleotide reductase, partial [Acidobacteria bacterium]|nr:vitamin B12-dependent ribonucleotide reductase [Acidobacteriota bacterium]MDW7983966.1 vitamin B12-dependent ribonucleotide reductase [Acidobacteriota bacterium]